MYIIPNDRRDKPKGEQMKKTHRHVLVVRSDDHAGSEFGLTRADVPIQRIGPDGELYDGRPQLNKIQEKLLAWDYNNVKFLREFAGKRDPIIFAWNGDPEEGIKHPDALMTIHQSDQHKIAVANADPILSLPNCREVLIMSSTPAHNFGNNSAENIIADILAPKYPRVKIGVYNHWYKRIDGVLCDISHHGPGASQRIWLDGNSTLQYLRDLVIREALAGREQPRLVVRSHVHIPQRQVWEHDGQVNEIVVTPPMCGINDYARMKGRSPGVLVWGMTIFEIIDGKLTDTIKLYETVDIRTKGDINYAAK